MHLLFKIIVLLSTVLITSCSGESSSDIEKYIATVKTEKPGKIKKLPEFKVYVAQEYTTASIESPFARAKKIHIEKPREITSSFEIFQQQRPDRDRKREYLESFVLDSVSMVGTLTRGNENWALLRDKNNLVHKAKVGNYLGTNSGEIISINNTSILLKELISDGDGGWMYREIELSLVVE